MSTTLFTLANLKEWLAQKRIETAADSPALLWW